MTLLIHYHVSKNWHTQVWGRRIEILEANIVRPCLKIKMAIEKLRNGYLRPLEIANRVFQKKPAS